ERPCSMLVVVMAFHSYRQVRVCDLVHRSSDWSRVPRLVVVKTLALHARVWKALGMTFVPPDVPETIFWNRESIASDGPYGSSEDYYMLDYVSWSAPPVSMNFEDGRIGATPTLSIESEVGGEKISALLAAT